MAGKSKAVKRGTRIFTDAGKAAKERERKRRVAAKRPTLTSAEQKAKIAEMKKAKKAKMNKSIEAEMKKIMDAGQRQFDPITGEEFNKGGLAKKKIGKKVAGVFSDAGKSAKARAAKRKANATKFKNSPRGKAWAKEQEAKAAATPTAKKTKFGYSKKDAEGMSRAKSLATKGMTEAAKKKPKKN